MTWLVARVMRDRLLLSALSNLLSHVEEGVHIVDDQGVTRVYNRAMEEIEGMRAEDVVGKHILEAYKGWQEENSTLLTALRTRTPIHRQNQHYLNLMGKPIATVNTTVPLFDGEDLVGALEISRNYTEVSKLSDELQSLRAQLIKPEQGKGPRKHYTFDMLIGQDKQYLMAIKIAKRAAATSSSVMIVGETGTGKELFAQSIHYESARRDKPFLAINCAAMPETLLESLLFGTTKGSFTGAMDRPGLFEQAHGGTLFLDEINSMSLALQAKLLRVLQESYVRRVGGLQEIAVDVRIIAATNENPEGMIKEGTFRKDLYYRINVLSLRIPSLKERPEDILLLVDFFVRHFNTRLGKDVWFLSDELLNWVKGYEWRGNVRELQNFVESAMNMVHDEHVIHLEHLPVYWQEQLRSSLREGSDAKDTDKTTADHNPDIKVQGNLALQVDPNLPLNDQLAALEKRLIAWQLSQAQGNITKAAERLGLSRQNLQYKLKKTEL